MLTGIGLMGYVVIGLLTVFLTLVGNIVFRSKSEDVYNRIEEMELFASGTEEDKLMNKTALQRIYLMIEERVVRQLEKSKKQGNMRSLKMKMIQANIHDVTPQQHMAKRLIFMIAGLLLTVLTKNALIIFVVVIACYFLPDILLNKALEKRQIRIKSEIPDFLDLLSATAPSAKTIEDAIRKVCDRTEGQVTLEFQRTLDQLNAGKKMRDALNEFAERCGVGEIDTFVSQINQSEIFGTPVEKTLEAQAEKMRTLKRHIAELKARKATVTLLMPGLLLLVTIMIVIVGPHIVQFLGAMKNFS